MAKTLNIWHYNMSAPWPTDPVEMAKVSEMLFAAIDNALKTGQLLEFGTFRMEWEDMQLPTEKPKIRLGGCPASSRGSSPRCTK